MGMAECVSALSFGIFEFRILLLLLLAWMSQQEAMAAESLSAASWESSAADGSAPSRDQQQHRKLVSDHGDEYHHHRLHLNLRQQQQVMEGEHHKWMRSQRWYGNSSSSSNSSSNPCIFESSTAASFSYLHVGYVYYFNISSSTVFFQADTDECLGTCTIDCTCSAVVYDRDTESCYEFHQYIPLQTLPFNPVRKGETLSAYIKVQRGTSSNAPSLHSMPTSAAAAILTMVAAAALALIWPLPDSLSI